MHSNITIGARILGQNPVFEDWFISLPPQWKPPAMSMSLRDLIGLIVIDEVSVVQESELEPRFERLLIRDETEQERTNGKTYPGNGDNADFQAAFSAAISAYKDGLYYVFVDGEEIRDLDEKVELKLNGRENFFRLETYTRE